MKGSYKMAIRRLATIEKDECLRKISKPVEKFDKKIVTLLQDMLETMIEAKGVGIAAPQVGILKRIIIVDVGDGPLELINPEIIEESGEQIDEEGCLSIPGYACNVKRPEFVKVKALNRSGSYFESEGSGLFARAICHEIDHLNGVMIVDKKSEDIDITSKESIS